MPAASPSAPRLAHLPLLDSLRGWAAISVFFHHTLLQGFFQALPGNQWLAAVQANRAAVLLFFTLSGYVIGATNRTAWSGAAVRNYAWRRFLRIEPIYLVALLLGLAMGPAIGFRELAGHLGYLQNFDLDMPGRVQPLVSNNALWSLHYEVVYYLLFIAWWRWPATVPISLGAGLVASFAFATGKFPALPAFVGSEGTGLAFWLGGLLLSRCTREARTKSGEGIWAHIAWLHAAQHAATVTMILRGLGLIAAPDYWLPFGDLVMLPGCITLVALAAQLRLPSLRFWSWTAFLMALTGCFLVLATHKPLDDPRWAGVLGFALLGILLFRWVRSAGLGAMATVGTFSYALYAIHTPMLVAISRWSGPTATLPVALAAAVLAWITAFALAAWLELRLQPRLRGWLDVRRPARIPSSP